ncbi:hypothetical protein ALC53_01448 [Atta colombica]|uniref:Uncharacterized protein n=1 Tax=Atta colombica TaxID=520822 RepID=A0A195BV70_9HYME|nr:hypothetical protein ALC53_01448 [Atta colombica]
MPLWEVLVLHKLQPAMLLGRKMVMDFVNTSKTPATIRLLFTDLLHLNHPFCVQFLYGEIELVRMRVCINGKIID